MGDGQMAQGQLAYETFRREIEAGDQPWELRSDAVQHCWAVVEQTVQQAAKQPLLGLATTKALLMELKARGGTEHRPQLREDADDLHNAADDLLKHLPEEVLAYRTVDGD